MDKKPRIPKSTAMQRTKIAQEDYSGTRRIFKLSFIVMFVIGVIAYLIFTLRAKPIVYMLSGQYGAYYAMLAIAPALVLVSEKVIS